MSVSRRLRSDPRAAPRHRRVCADCGAPVRDDWLPVEECWHEGQLRQRLGEARYAEFRRQVVGADPPCFEQCAWAQAQRRERRFRRTMRLVFAASLAGVAAAAWMFLR